MPPILKVALLQLYSDPTNVSENFSRAVTCIHNAARDGADIAVLPEYHLGKFQAQVVDPVTATEHSATYLKRYQSLAKELKIAIVPGTFLEYMARGDAENDRTCRLVNVAYFIGPNGELLGRYQKKNLWHPERQHITADTNGPHQAFDTPFGRIGLLVCWDLAFPEAFRALVADRAQVIICPARWLAEDVGNCRDYNSNCESLFIETVCVARAFENTCAVVFVNAAAPSDSKNCKDSRGHEYVGRSQIAVPLQGAKGMLNAVEGVSIVEIDMAILRTAEEAYKVRDDMGKPGWHY